MSIMQLFVIGQETHNVEIPENQNVGVLKEWIKQVENISPDDQVLYHAGHPLDDEQLLSDCLVNGSSVVVSVRLLGGKVHGSLARAGKVKGQTPKVEKQEKKKAKTGRAKRRMQYNRRFVNVVQTFGRRRGPNSNQ